MQCFGVEDRVMFCLSHFTKDAYILAYNSLGGGGGGGYFGM